MIDAAETKSDGRRLSLAVNMGVDVVCSSYSNIWPNHCDGPFALRCIPILYENTCDFPDSTEWPIISVSYLFSGINGLNDSFGCELLFEPKGVKIDVFFALGGLGGIERVIGCRVSVVHAGIVDSVKMYYRFKIRSLLMGAHSKNMKYAKEGAYAAERRWQ